MNKLWTEGEMQILRDRYHSDGPTILSKEMNRSKVSLQRKAYYMGLSKRAPGEMTASEIAQLRKLHEEEKHKSRLRSPEYHEKRKKIVLLSNQKRRERKRGERICIRCDTPSIEHSTQYCLLHWAITMGNTCKRYDEAFARMLLDKLEQQKYRCALTGDPLEPSKNCSIDHIIPKSLGGALDDPNNLRWVTVDANRSKGFMSDAEFVAFCKRVVEHNSLLFIATTPARQPPHTTQ